MSISPISDIASQFSSQLSGAERLAQEVHPTAASAKAPTSAASVLREWLKCHRQDDKLHFVLGGTAAGVLYIDATDRRVEAFTCVNVPADRVEARTGFDI